MKLILVPSNPKHGPRVAISIANDGGDIDAFLETVVAPALVAFGWAPQNVQDAMHRIEVPGAVEEEAAPPVDDLTERSTPAPSLGRPKPPEGFTIVGHGVDVGEALEFPQADLAFSHAGGSWTSTHLANGYSVWYAARNGSKTLAKLQAHVAAL